MVDLSGPYFGDATLALADGRVFRGRGFGAVGTAIGEVVFNTSMTGYQEILTDPSYAGQLVCLTVAEVGNVGCNEEDMESYRHGADALIVRSLSPVVSNWRASQSLPAFLRTRGRPGIAEIDTRALTRHLRERGNVVGAVSTDGTSDEALIERAREAPPMEGRALAHRVSTEQSYTWTTPGWGRTAPVLDVHVVAFDFGIKHAILQSFVDAGVKVTVVPSTATLDEILALEPDGIFLSNGPGDPAALTETIEHTKALLAHASNIPVFGICLGHQLLCLALGAETYKLKFGHHGGNHPVRHEADGRVEITAQNHGFAAASDSLTERTALTHLNLFDRTVAGMKVRDRDVWAVQYHPEAAPGPHDSTHLFAEFAELLRRRRAEAS